MCQFLEEFQTLHVLVRPTLLLNSRMQSYIAPIGEEEMEALSSYGIFPESSFLIWACVLEAYSGAHTCLLSPSACQPLQELCGSFIGAPDGCVFF